MTSDKTSAKKVTIWFLIRQKQEQKIRVKSYQKGLKPFFGKITCIL